MPEEAGGVTAVEDVRRELAEAGDPGRAETVQRYFQVRPGGYGDGDRFLGVPVPVQRRIAARYWRLIPVGEAATLLAGEVHEERLTAIFVLVRHFRAGDAEQRQRVFDLVLASTRHIDNWDLVDSVAPSVVGPWLADRDRAALDRLAGSDSPWERRMAVVATLAFIRAGDFAWTFRLARRLLDDPHDLVRKAVGWTLREVGNRDRAAEEAFLVRHYAAMPRVMLRYAIEKFDPALRRRYLTGDI